MDTKVKIAILTMIVAILPTLYGCSTQSNGGNPPSSQKQSTVIPNSQNISTITHTVATQSPTAAETPLPTFTPRPTFTITATRDPKIPFKIPGNNDPYYTWNWSGGGIQIWTSNLDSCLWNNNCPGIPHQIDVPGKGPLPIYWFFHPLDQGKYAFTWNYAGETASEITIMLKEPVTDVTLSAQSAFAIDYIAAFQKVGDKLVEVPYGYTVDNGNIVRTMAFHDDMFGDYPHDDAFQHPEKYSSCGPIGLAPDNNFSKLGNNVGEGGSMMMAWLRPSLTVTHFTNATNRVPLYGLHMVGTPYTPQLKLCKKLP